jgi:hypothetical protein
MIPCLASALETESTQVQNTHFKILLFSQEESFYLLVESITTTTPKKRKEKNSRDMQMFNNITCATRILYL